MTFFTVPDAGICEYEHKREVTGELTDITPSRCTGIDGHNHSSFESECKCGSSMLDFDPATGIGMIIGVEAKEGRWLITRRMRNTTQKLLFRGTYIWHIGDGE